MIDPLFLYWAASIIGCTVVEAADYLAAGQYLIWQLFWQWTWGG